MRVYLFQNTPESILLPGPNSTHCLFDLGLGNGILSYVDIVNR